MNLSERNLRRHQWRMATEEARKQEGPLFELGVVSLGAVIIVAALGQGMGIGR